MINKKEIVAMLLAGGTRKQIVRINSEESKTSRILWWKI